MNMLIIVFFILNEVYLTVFEIRQKKAHFHAEKWR